MSYTQFYNKNKIYSTTISLNRAKPIKKNLSSISQKEPIYNIAPTTLCAIFEKKQTTSAMYYVHSDHLGSITMLTSSSGACVEEFSYDAWGRRRNPADWTGVPSSFIFDRGYTGHEMLDAFGLVNMNGRMYDPVLGRMLSPDNYVSLPEHTQGYNRYTYALNNPLVITDPSGDNPAIIAMIAYSAIVSGLNSANNGDGFLQGFATGVATGALSAGVGAVIGPVVSGSTRLAFMANAGIHTAVAGGITYGIDALANNSSFNWKGYGLNIATSMAFAGLTYQKPGAQPTHYSRADLEAAGITDPRRGYGMRYPDPPDWTWGKNERGAVINLPSTEIVSTPINRPSPYETLRLLWDLRILGSSIPDHIALSVGLNSTFVRGQSMTWSFNVLTRGKEPGFSITVTDMERKGGEIDWGINLTMSRYDGNPLDINKASLEGKIKSVSAAYIYGGEVHTGYNPSGKVIWRGASTGFGFSYGVSYGSGVTRQIWP